MECGENVKTWKIPVVWSMMGVINIEANTLNEAIEIAKDKDGVIPIPTDGDFLDGSWEVDCSDESYLREWYNGNQEDDEIISDSMKFANAQEMYDMIVHSDIYNDEKELYAFLYNEEGAICVYHITNDEAKKLEQKKKNFDEYWGAFLGIGGTIYDDPMEFCNDQYKGCWRRV